MSILNGADGPNCEQNSRLLWGRRVPREMNLKPASRKMTALPPKTSNTRAAVGEIPDDNQRPCQDDAA
jgi:hypothetical protein